MWFFNWVYLLLYLPIIVFEWEGFASNPFPKDPTLSPPLSVCVCVCVCVCVRVRARAHNKRARTVTCCQ